MGGNQLHVFSRKFEGKIWKTLSSKTGEYLAIEVRNESQHQVSFCILNTYQRKWLWEDVIFEEPWWINLQHFGENELQFIYYEDGNSPDQKQYLNIDIHTQEVKEESAMVVEDVSSTIQLPVHYLESTDYFNTVSKYIKEKLNVAPTKAVDYLESKGLIAISYYLWQVDHLANFLLIMDNNGSIIIHELLADNLQTIGIDTFFMINSSLYTIRDKAELLIYDL